MRLVVAIMTGFFIGCGSGGGSDDEIVLSCNNAGGNQVCTIVQGPISTGTCTSTTSAEAPAAEKGGTQCQPAGTPGGATVTQ
jgi:hypothetical protein